MAKFPLMPLLQIHPSESVRQDLIALGEVMLRLDPGESRIREATSFDVWEGGGEYNVAKSLSTCFGHRTALVSSLVDNEVGRLIEGLIRRGGVDLSHLRWLPFDGLGRTARNGVNFTERGYGLRGALGVSDRGHTATSLMKPGDHDWDAIFAGGGARWFHTGGVFASLGEGTSEILMEAMQSARRHGVIVSYDLNYRASLWKDRGGKESADALNRRILPQVDVLFGIDGLNSAVQPGGDLNPLEKRLVSLSSEFPNLRVIATPLRRVLSASLNDWGGALYAQDHLYVSRVYPSMGILDRIGGGDSFASGVIHGLMEGHHLQEIVEIGTAHGALAMTTPGDTSMASLDQVMAMVRGDGFAVNR